jgi:hypothetical protein
MHLKQTDTKKHNPPGTTPHAITLKLPDVAFAGAYFFPSSFFRCMFVLQHALRCRVLELGGWKVFVEDEELAGN